MATDNLDEVFPVSEPMEAEPVQEEVVQVEEPVTEPEPVAEPEPQPEPETRHVPINALLDERDKRKELERRLAEYEAKQQAPQTAEIPDAYDDPQGYANHFQRQLDQKAVEMRFEMSDRFARSTHGDETVQAALDWANGRAGSNPAFVQDYMGQQDPIGWIVQQHKRDAMLSDIGDNPEDWFEREAAKRGWQKPNAPAPAAVADVVPKQAVTPAKVPPRSLANQGTAPSDIRQTASGPLAGVDSLFS